jgi:glutamyl-tRNA synthetase
LPEALRNYLALLGWSYDGTTEIFSRDALLEKFTLARVNPSPGTFDYAKLTWFNAYYINHILTLDDLTARLVPFLAAAGLVGAAAADPAGAEFAQVREAAALQKDRLQTLVEGPELLGYFLRDELEPYDPALLIPKKGTREEALVALEAAARLLSEVDLNDESASEARFRTLAAELGVKPGALFMPIRVAVTGRTHSPGLFETMRVIGAARCERRLAAAIAALGAWRPAAAVEA